MRKLDSSGECPQSIGNILVVYQYAHLSRRATTSKRSRRQEIETRNEGNIICYDALSVEVIQLLELAPSSTNLICNNVNWDFLMGKLFVTHKCFNIYGPALMRQGSQTQCSIIP